MLCLLYEHKKQNTFGIGGYGLYLYFSGLSLRRTSERLSSFVKRNHVSVWNWIQKYKPKKTSTRKRKIDEFIIDETLIKAGSEFIWLWVAIEPKNKEILEMSIPKERNMFVAERFISSLLKICGKHPFDAILQGQDRMLWWLLSM